MKKFLKNHLNNKSLIGLAGHKSILAKNFIKTYKSKFKFKLYKNDINNYKKFKKWVCQNRDLNYFINFAAMTSVADCDKNKVKALLTNYKSVTKMTKIFQTEHLNNFLYFLSISSSHVFKKSKFLLKEESEKKPDNYYGKVKLLMEKYLLRNINNFYYQIGVARIFNYHDRKSKKSFFINDIKKKLTDKTKRLNFFNVNTKRDFIHPNNISTGLKHMLKNKLKGDYNICTGKGTILKNIILYLNKKNKKKKLIFYDSVNKDLIGCNKKLLKTGWNIKKKINLNYFE